MLHPLIDQWGTRAACIDADPELFAPRQGTSRTPPQHDPHVQQALAYCSICPVIQQCHTYADTCRDVPIIGVWGGQYRDRDTALNRQPLDGRGLATGRRIPRTNKGRS